MNVYSGRVLRMGVIFLAGLAFPSPTQAQSWTAVDAAREALSTHPAVIQAGAATRAARSGADVARSAYLPSLRVGASVVRFEEPMVVAPLHAFNPMAPPLFDDALVRSQAGLAYTLFDGGVRGGALSAARAQATGAAALGSTAEAEVILAVVEAYVGAAAAAEVVEASQRRRRALLEEVARAERAFEAGAAPRVEILRARAALAEADAEQASADGNLDASRRILARLTGRSSLPLALTIPEVGSSDDPETVFEQAPRVMAAESALDAAQGRHRAARGAFLPRVEAVTALDQYGAIGESFSAEWQAGLQVSLPVFVGGRRRAEVRQRAAEVDAAAAAVDGVRLQMQNEQDRARAALAAARGRVIALSSAEEQFAEVVRVEALALSEGSGIQRDLLSAEASLYAVRAQLSRARASVVTARTALAHATGVLSLDWLMDHLEVQR